MMFKSCLWAYVKYCLIPICIFGGGSVLVMRLFYPDLIYENNDLAVVISSLFTLIGILVGLGFGAINEID